MHGNPASVFAFCLFRRARQYSWSTFFLYIHEETESTLRFSTHCTLFPSSLSFARSHTSEQPFPSPQHAEPERDRHDGKTETDSGQQTVKNAEGLNVKVHLLFAPMTLNLSWVEVNTFFIEKRIARFQELEEAFPCKN
jgi:hypothetical protein